jgi:signal transduction histidine kinase
VTKHTRFLANIRASGRHLLQLINDILDISKVEAGKVVLQSEPLAVADSLEDILVIARGLAHKKSQVVYLEIETDLPPLHADPIRFKQILFNLLSNAVKFTAEGGHIEVSARRAVPWEGEPTDARAPAAEPTCAPAPEPETCLEIAVRDSGVGIRAEDLPKLFHEFTQLETTRGQHENGTGLGLALTRRLVELHGGRIRGESDGEGQGATFRLILPWNGEARHGQSAAAATS